jgi:hypothetical protein
MRAGNQKAVRSARWLCLWSVSRTFRTPMPRCKVAYATADPAPPAPSWVTVCNRTSGRSRRKPSKNPNQSVVTDAAAVLNTTVFTAPTVRAASESSSRYAMTLLARMGHVHAGMPRDARRSKDSFSVRAFRFGIQIEELIVEPRSRRFLPPCAVEDCPMPDSTADQTT